MKLAYLVLPLLAAALTGCGAGQSPEDTSEQQVTTMPPPVCQVVIGGVSSPC